MSMFPIASVTVGSGGIIGLLLLSIPSNIYTFTSSSFYVREASATSELHCYLVMVMSDPQCITTYHMLYLEMAQRYCVKPMFLSSIFTFAMAYLDTSATAGLYWLFYY